MSKWTKEDLAVPANELPTFSTGPDSAVPNVRRGTITRNAESGRYWVEADPTPGRDNVLLNGCSFGDLVIVVLNGLDADKLPPLR